jgi:hypothetical protein
MHSTKGAAEWEVLKPQAAIILSNKMAKTLVLLM